jgi:hypothetical protein
VPGHARVLTQHSARPEVEEYQRTFLVEGCAGEDDVPRLEVAKHYSPGMAVFDRAGQALSKLEALEGGKKLTRGRTPLEVLA